MKTGKLLPVCCVVMLATASLLAGQQRSRAGEVEALRRQKFAESRPEEPKRLEGLMLWIQERKILEKLETPGGGYKGLRPRLGGLSTGSGFAFGIQFDRVQMLQNQVDFSLQAAASRREYQLYQSKIDLPRLAGERVFISATAAHRAMPQEDYFGLGARSSSAARSNYLHEDSLYSLGGGVRPLPWLRAGADIGWLQLNVGSGTDPRFATTERVFTDANTPGLDRQPDFLKAQWWAAIDTRDSAGNPRSGGYYGATYTTYADRSFDEFGFARFQTELQQYVPFSAGHRVIAMRFRAAFDDPKQGQRVPFYLQQTLGGSNDLRGFREFRFRDKNLMVSNLEYRWEAFSGLDMALFADAGKVFGSLDDLNLNNLETSYGLGFRFNTEKNVFWRIDIARSREGTRAFIKFENIF
jgi:outer membrane protein assembly factor BamA